MASVVQIVLQSQNRTGPGFAGAQAGLVGLGASADRTALRAQALTDRIRHQQDQLRLLGGQLDVAAGQYGPVTLATERARIRFDALSSSMQRNQRALNDLTTGPDRLGRIATGVGALNGALGVFGVALGVQEVGRFTAETIGMGNSMERTTILVRELAGTQERYKEVVDLATQSQRLFGGSFDASLRGMGDLVPLAIASDTALKNLNQTRNLLAIKNRDQGIEGANTALTEFLTGKGAEAGLSLAERYNLPKDQLLALKNSGADAEGLLAGIDAILAQQNITAAALEKQLDTTAQSYRDLGIAGDALKTKIGGGLAAALQPYAESLAGVFNILSGNVNQGLGQVYSGGNRALGYTKEQSDERTRSWSMDWMNLAPRTQPAATSPQEAPPAAPVRVVMPTPQNAPPVRVVTSPPQTITVRPAAPQVAVVAPRAPAATVQSGDTYHITVPVTGSVITKGQLVDEIHAGLLEKQRRNGTTGIK